MSSYRVGGLLVSSYRVGGSWFPVIGWGVVGFQLSGGGLLVSSYWVEGLLVSRVGRVVCEFYWG